MQANSDGIQTATMAKIYADQGLYQKAAAIYRRLLVQEPGRTDFVQALARIERLMASGKPSESQGSAALISRWITLLLRYRLLKDLDKLKQSIGSLQ
jgi:hypothetical protein